MVVPLQIVDEVEGLQSAYGLESVQLHKEETSADSSRGSATVLEIEVRPEGEEANTLVWVTLLVTLPLGYPLKAVPEVEVYRSRGLGDTQIKAVRAAAVEAIERHGRQECGCLVPVVMGVASALAASASECCICQEVCKASEAIDAPCGDVFHERCLREWSEVKRRQRISEADTATEPTGKQLKALRRSVAQSEGHEEEARREVKQQQLMVEEADTRRERAQRKLHVAMGEHADKEDESGDSGEQDESDDDSDDDDDLGPVSSLDAWRQELKRPKIKFNNHNWGEGRKKNYKPSTTRNRRRAKKYVKQVEDIVEERKERAKADMMQEKVRPELMAYQDATQRHRDALALLDKARLEVCKEEKKTAELREQAKALENDLQALRDSIIEVKIPCPVCQNPLDPDGAIQLQRATGAAQEDPDARAEAQRKRRAAEAAAGRIDLRLEVTDDYIALPRECHKLLGVYVRDPEPAEGFPSGRPTYTGPRESIVLHFFAGPDLWLVSRGRRNLFRLVDDARTPDYAQPGSCWQVATSEGFCYVRGLRATCVNSQRVLSGPQNRASADAGRAPVNEAQAREEGEREAREAKPPRSKDRGSTREAREAQSPAKVRAPDAAAKAATQARRRSHSRSSPAQPKALPKGPRSPKKLGKAKKKDSLEELTELIAELMMSFEGEEERLLETVDELLQAMNQDPEAKDVLMSAVDQHLAKSRTP